MMFPPKTIPKDAIIIIRSGRFRTMYVCRAPCVMFDSNDTLVLYRGKSTLHQGLDGKITKIDSVNILKNHDILAIHMGKDNFIFMSQKSTRLVSDVKLGKFFKKHIMRTTK